MFGAIVRPTNVLGVLAIDVNKTDFFGQPAYPTTLLYNPYALEVKVKLSVGSKPVKVWDAVANRWLTGVAANEVEITVGADDAVLATVVPADQPSSLKQGRLYAGNVIVDYSALPEVDKRPH